MNQFGKTPGCLDPLVTVLSVIAAEIPSASVDESFHVPQINPLVAAIVGSAPAPRQIDSKAAILMGGDRGRPSFPANLRRAGC